MLEVQSQDLLRRPLAQIEPPNVLDLIALHELPESPKALKNALAAFVQRVSGEIVDIPGGKPWLDFLEEFAVINGKHVPETFRACIAREAERGEARAPERTRAVVAHWALEEPLPFLLGAANTRFVTVHHPPPASSPNASSPRERAPRAERAAAAPKPKAATTDDSERRQWITDMVLERVAEAPEAGLSEPVLLAGVKHRAKDLFPTLVPADVLSVLRELKAAGRIRGSAGRWASIRRW
ncbi:MAG: hypothetical protein H0V89_09615 [Deltaproteobacteria bacterium]|nr:hypothetical protein [Deltaproteobacteria bacterium]